MRLILVSVTLMLSFSVVAQVRVRENLKQTSSSLNKKKVQAPSQASSSSEESQKGKKRGR